MNIRLFISALLATVAGTAFSQEAVKDTVPDLSFELDEFTLVQKQDSRRNLRNSALNTELITQAEIKRAACCNLGESFTTNPSVDVNYSDAATGARQIRLLGLPGTYVQMLTENIPNLRGAAAQYGLGYIPGPWMQSIQVSKGASSVKNGYESVTGQINVEFLKPQTDQSLNLNMYADHLGKVEANASGNIHLSDKLSTGLLIHGENGLTGHDSNGDGFLDSPRIKQISAMNRWGWFTDDYILQAGGRYLGEKRESGQMAHHHHYHEEPYIVGITTNRGELWLKNAYMFDHEHGANIALILSGSLHDQKGKYGHREYDVIQGNLYASLLFERDFDERNSISAGLSFNHDDYRQHFRLISDLTLPLDYLRERESTSGGYAQYTYNLDKKLILMAGLRYDYSSLYGNMLTPRLHARWTPSAAFSLNLSAGKGYRSPVALADNSYLLASAREIIVEEGLHQESAWNMGAGISGKFILGSQSFDWGAEYYFTDFRNQTVVDLDRSPMAAYIINARGKSFSHAAQVELTWKPIEELSILAAYRYTDVRLDYGRGLVSKPLTSKSKCLFSVNYEPMMGLWQFDATLAVTGKGRLPNPAVNADGLSWQPEYKAFPTLNVQVTRNFKHWSIYVGGENLTGYRQKQPIIGAADPWGSTFDATMIYAPVHGAMAYIGFRYTFTKY